MSTMLDINLIRDYLIAVGCRVQYPILVNAFKKHLCHPDPIVQGKVRTQFKDFVNRLATVNVENNMKFITLRPEFRPPAPDTRQQQQHKKPALQPNNQPQHTPNGSNNHAIRHTPVRTKSITSLSKQPNDQYHLMHNSSSLQPIDTIRRRWAIEACNCNYNKLLALLRKDPKLAPCKDIINGYTALHWAAKFGNTDIIKLIAGTYSVSVNIKSSAGHTPLHVAYMYNRLEVANLLIHNYQANPNIRDHSGKKPMQYCQTTK
uniref:Ankyrin repeat domain-containing protein SOWAHB n=1 Tax=Aceria tosichella TaxID=561515 RepID=A0A6G1SK52_9ACAR